MPDHAAGLARWFSEAVREEVAELEKTSRSQLYELLAGARQELINPGEAVFTFLLADANQVPEDSNGRLKAAGRDYRASVVGQQGNRLHLLVEGDPPMPASIPNAVLEIDDTALLRKLADVLEGHAEAGQQFGALIEQPFFPAKAHVGFEDLPSTLALATVTGETRRVIEQILGSSLTYVWGPPGTGKTYAISRGVAALVARGERVLVMSHTHAAIDKVLYEIVKEDGPIPRSSELVKTGRLVRIGRTTDPKVPAETKLADIVAAKAEEMLGRIRELEEESKPLAEVRSRCRAIIKEWERLDELRERLRRAEDSKALARQERVSSEQHAAILRRDLESRRDDLLHAQRAWFARARKVAKANSAVQSTSRRLLECENAVRAAGARIEESTGLIKTLHEEMEEQASRANAAGSRSEAQTRVAGVGDELAAIEAEIDALQEQLSELEQLVVSSAAVVFCTLTKQYVGSEMTSQRFDAVVLDEISMALPPLIFLAADRANRRIVLVGDFLQLPPIVRSDAAISGDRLKRDVFHLSKVATDGRPSDSPTLAKLTVQRRMAPEIADVARHLVYGPAGLADDLSVQKRAVPAWLETLPDGAVVIVDTAGLHCWSGKQPGSLSRFNFYTATLAVELAAMAGHGLPPPSVANPPPIGIATPYAAQRRIIGKLIQAMELGAWVLGGTVHAFQGSEAELVIFDTVLDEPYYSARLCDPKARQDVIRELNVAVTRARSRFILLGSSDWLNAHARPGSALGDMWRFLVDRASLVSAAEVVEGGFLEKVTQSTVHGPGWSLPENDGVPVHDILDETTFFDWLEEDLRRAEKSIFGLAAYFGEYRWPTVQPYFAAALARGVEVTFVVPPVAEAQNRRYVDAAIEQLRHIGAIVVEGSGLHGKDIVIDEKIHYTGSLNWASHRGRSEVMHRTQAPALAKLVLQFLQAKYVRASAEHPEGGSRTCPVCGGSTHLVNQRKQNGPWDRRQALKVGCANPACQRYLRDVDERAPYRGVPTCSKDPRTKRRRVKRGRGEVWQCPKHPKDCAPERVVPGDPS